ncbi:ABC transporter ATP-binding protein [Paenibacillus chibensis]|uniref:ABC transporter ATP-binding protein n=1 Tax=Paenibacillus chibensis TaxID=59846 RepID=A0ABU6PXB8_9BACL|nr:ABC transporter ATP-binding protein [Paenibacillus chibensis]
METTVSVEQVSRAFGKKTVLSGVSLHMEKGQIYGLIGPSGAGKTTLVKMMVGMDKPDQGTIEVLRTPMPSLSMLQQIGYMAQSDALYNELTGEENLRFFASMFNMGKTEQKKRIAYAAELVNLTDELKKKVSAYSGGMKRRLSLAIALLHNPPILILDEPTVGIDPELRQSIWAELIRLKGTEQKTIIITTHVMDEAEKCDVLAMVREGRILASGTPVQLKQQYEAENLEAVFLRAGGKES